MQASIVKLSLTASELRQLPKAHAGYFVTSCLAINDISLFLRLFLMAKRTVRKADELGGEALQYAVNHHQLIERALSSKVIEYLILFENYQKKISRAKRPVLAEEINSFTKQITENIKIGVGYDLAVWYRNKASFHYDVTSVTDLIFDTEIQTDLHIFVAEVAGNAHYAIGEQVLFARVDQLGDGLEVLTAYCKWVEDAASFVIDVHHKLSVLLVETFFEGKCGTQIELEVGEDLLLSGDSLLPIFVR